MNKYLAEFVGTGLLTYVILATNNPIISALVYAVMLIVVLQISSGYLNPAITLVMTSIGKINVHELLPYMMSQFFGALVALETYKRFSIQV
jgi:glycerol uptake facilitator-like aquaporin|tara:strand:- start:3324 stop:3596 length:273 start_codon:yes stop_codon:yes gene_type:complete